MLAVSGQLSSPSLMVSLSSSSSQASPISSPSVSVWSSSTPGQVSSASAVPSPSSSSSQTSPMSSPSVSSWSLFASSGQLSLTSRTRSLSSSSSQTSPMLSLSVSSWSVFASVGQLSSTSRTRSLSSSSSQTSPSTGSVLFPVGAGAARVATSAADNALWKTAMSSNAPLYIWIVEVVPRQGEMLTPKSALFSMVSDGTAEALKLFVDASTPSA